MTKKRTRRSREKYPALNPALNLKTRSKLIDYDYISKLSEEDKAFLNTFTEEYTNAGFSKNKKKHLHKSKRLKKDCYDRNNSRNRDILTKAEAMGKVTLWEDVDRENFERCNEDYVIENLDKKRSEEDPLE